MKGIIRRAVSSVTATSLIASLVFLTASPAAADACVPVPGQTVPVGADIDGDGQDDVYIPAISNIQVCAEVVGGYGITLPTVGSCGPSCTYVKVYADFGGDADLILTISYAADSQVYSERFTIDGPLIVPELGGPCVRVGSGECPPG